MSIIRCVNVLIRGIFYILFVILCFRVGIRRNNSDAINVTKARFAPLFHGLNMSVYMETFFFRDSVLRTKCPQLLLNFLNTMSPTVFQATIAKERAEILCWNKAG